MMAPVPAPVSVVIPVFNGEDLIGATLESVFNQTMPPAEVVVVDDGSTDGTERAVRRFTSAIYKRQANAGAAAARNTGARLATAPFLAFLDADDLWPPTRMEHQLPPLLVDGTLDYTAGLMVQVKDDGDRNLKPLSPPEPSRLATSLLIRRAAFDRVGPFDAAFAIGDTIEWFARALDAGLRGVTIPEIVLLRRVHARNMGKTADGRQKAYLRVLREVVRRRRETGRL